MSCTPSRPSDPRGHGSEWTAGIVEVALGVHCHSPHALRAIHEDLDQSGQLALLKLLLVSIVISGMGLAGCAERDARSNALAEEFWNCADIVFGSASSPSPVAPSPVAPSQVRLRQLHPRQLHPRRLPAEQFWNWANIVVAVLHHIRRSHLTSCTFSGGPCWLPLASCTLRVLSV